MEKRFGERGLVIVDVHTPEFDRERSRKNVEAAVREHGLLSHSHFLDNHMRYWRALDNEYWPAIYIVDGQGQIRESAFGVTGAFGMREILGYAPVEPDGSVKVKVP